MASSPSNWMQFPAFRRYEATRQEANNAMMALLAGSQLAVHTLQLTAGSERLLPEMFPGVDHVTYFNLRTDAATEILLQTGHHLGAVAVPYALAVHEDFVMSTLELVCDHGFSRKAVARNGSDPAHRVRAWNMHESLWATLGAEAPARGSLDSLEHFHLLREMRNCQIHSGGTVSRELSAAASQMSPGAASRWSTLGRRKPSDLVDDDPLRFTTSDILLAFAVTKDLGRAVNRVLAERMDGRQWSRICVEDYMNQSNAPTNTDKWMRGLFGHAAMCYAARPIADHELVGAAVEAGCWKAGRVWVPRRSERTVKRSRPVGTRRPAT